MRLLSATCLVAALLSASPAWAQTPPTSPQAPAALPTPRVAPAAPRGLNWQRYPRASEVSLQNVAAYVRIRPSDREDVAVAIVNPGSLEAPTVRVSGRRLIIDGRQRGRIRGCSTRGTTGFEVDLARPGRVGGEQLPIIEIRVPEHAIVAASGAMRMHVTAADTAEIHFDACGDIDVERVHDTADVSVSHEGTMRIHDAGELEARVAGNGEIMAGYIRDGLTVSIAGIGRFQAARADGPANLVVQGPGELTIRSGATEALTVVLNGTGRVIHNGTAESLDAFVVGPGLVRVRDVEGETVRRVIGGGEIHVGQ